MVRQPRVTCSYKCLPLWGEKCRHDKINFTWPCIGFVDPFGSGITLKSLEFKSYNTNAISSVKCVLSTDECSPTFAKESFNGHEHPQTITFEDVSKVRAVAAYDTNGSWNSCTRIRFLDGNKNQLYEYNPYNRSEEGTIHELAEN